MLQYLDEGIIEGKVGGRYADDDRVGVAVPFRETPSVAVVRVPGAEHLVGELETGEASVVLLRGDVGYNKSGEEVWRHAKGENKRDPCSWAPATTRE